MDVAFTRSREVRPGDALAQPVFVIMDLGKPPAVEGYECDGLVGYEMFGRFGVRIDYARGELVLTEPAKFTRRRMRTWCRSTVQRIPIIQGTLDGVPARLSVDTGSRVSLTLHSPFVGHGARWSRNTHAAADVVVGWGVGGPSAWTPGALRHAATRQPRDPRWPPEISTPATRVPSRARTCPATSAAAC